MVLSFLGTRIIDTKLSLNDKQSLILTFLIHMISISIGFVVFVLLQFVL